uniref:NADH dehydrogenase [ubiquinone] 1 beta subcomplex subunit 11, mitochondrial n=1 Tax=Melopsittacus undulatus TaxID=13146 RepID=A0A8V5GNH0_MELUD
RGLGRWEELGCGRGLDVWGSLWDALVSLCDALGSLWDALLSLWMHWGPYGCMCSLWDACTHGMHCAHYGLQNPDYHGFSAEPDADVLNMRVVFFTGVSIAIVLGSVFLHYLPDYGLQQWARREAELQVMERERRGLPLIDPNYYDPARLTLPPPE